MVNSKANSIFLSAMQSEKHGGFGKDADSHPGMHFEMFLLTCTTLKCPNLFIG
jgi:hypothetical protein